MNKIALAVLMVLGMVSVAQAEERNAVSTTDYVPGHASQAEACASAKANAKREAYPKTIAEFDRCDCSIKQGNSEQFKWICNVDYKVSN